MRRGTLRRLVLASGFGLACSLALAGSAAAQATSLGITDVGPAVNGNTSVAYNITLSVYLQVWEDNGSIFGRFIGMDGVPKSAAFALWNVSPFVTFANPRVVHPQANEVEPNQGFVMVFESHLLNGTDETNITAQYIKYQPDKPPFIGLNWPVTPAPTDEHRQRLIDDVLISGAAQRMFVFYEELLSDGWYLKARASLLNSGLDGAPVTLLGPQAARFNARAAYDWQLRRYAIAWEGDSSTLSVAALDAATLQPITSATVLPASAGSQLAMAYLPDAASFVVTWTESDGQSLNVRGHVVSSASGALSGSPFNALATSGDDSWSTIDYDPMSRRLLVAAEGSDTPGSGTRILRGAILNENGAPSGSPFVLSSSTTSSGRLRPMLRASGGGQIAAGYVANDRALVERFELPAADPPGPRPSLVVGLVEVNDNDTVEASLPFSGCAADLLSPTGTGISSVQVWAFPLDGTAGALVGTDESFHESSFGTNAYGARFANCGFGVPLTSLTRGAAYRVEAHAYSTVSRSFTLIGAKNVTIATAVAADVTASGVVVSGSGTGASFVAFDDKHDVFLHAWQRSGVVAGRFMRFDGTPAGEEFTLASSVQNVAVLAYTRGSADDAFCVLFTASPATPSCQLVRFTGSGSSGGVLVGAPVAVAPSGTATDVVFNPRERRFLAAYWDGDVKVRSFGADATLSAAAVTIEAHGTVGGYTFTPANLKLAFDWQRNRYLGFYTDTISVPGCCGFPSATIGAYARMIDGHSEQPGAIIQVGIVPLGIASGLAVVYLPERDGFLAAWTTSGVRPGNFDIASRVIPNSGAQPPSLYVISRDGFDSNVSFDYDPISNRVLAAALGGDGTSQSNTMSGAIADGRGMTLSAGFRMPSGITASSFRVPNLIRSRDGQFAVSYMADGQAVFERLALVKASVPGPRFSNVLGHIDGPANGSTTGGPFRVGGWTLDLGASVSDVTGIDAVHVWAFPAGGGNPVFLGEDKVFDERSDIATTYGPHFAVSGFNVDASGLPGGTYTIVAYPHSALSGVFGSGDAVSVTIANESRPMMSLDAPLTGGTVAARFILGGWAIDRAAGLGPGIDAIHVWAVPRDGGPATFVGVPEYFRPRVDIAGVFGSQFASSGFQMTVDDLPPGAYRITAYAHSTVTGTFTISQSVDITVLAPVSNPVMSLDGPQDNETVQQPVTTGGWAIDTGADSGSGVDAIHVWAFPIVNGAIDAEHAQFVAQGTAGGSRPDVGAFYGSQFTNSGYTFLISGLQTGDYVLGVYARSTVSGTFNNVRFVQVTVQ